MPILNESKSPSAAAFLILEALIPVTPSASGSRWPALTTLRLLKSYMILPFLSGFPLFLALLITRPLESKLSKPGNSSNNWFCGGASTLNILYRTLISLVACLYASNITVNPSAAFSRLTTLER